MRAIAAVSLLLIFCCLPPDPPRRQIVVFHDISTSLDPDQTKEGMKIVNQIIDDAPPDVEIFVIPICENTEDAPEEWLHVPQPKWSKASTNAVQKKRNEMKARVAQQANVIRTQTTAASSSYASCISPALRRAARTAAEFDITDVVLVSDMIEECSYPLLGESVKLNLSGKRFDRAVQLVGAGGSLLALPAKVRVWVFRPSSAKLPPDFPPPDRLEGFWKRLFSRCGLQPSQVHWDANINQYLESL